MDQHPKTDSWKNSTNSLFRSYYLLFIACKSKQKSRKFQIKMIVFTKKTASCHSPFTRKLQSFNGRTAVMHREDWLFPRWEQKTAFKCRINVTYMAMKLRFVDEFSRKRSTPNISAWKPSVQRVSAMLGLHATPNIDLTQT